MEKTCTGCGETKSLAMFNKHRKGRFGRHPKCKACRAISNHALYLKNGKPPHDPRKWRQYKYGLTAEAYAALVKKQGSRCGICRRKKPLVVDHCHKSRKIRGLLCSRCNTGLGKLGDTVRSILKVLEYLKR